MENLIKALQIFLKYENNSSPTHCETEEMRVILENPDAVTDEDIEELEELGFTYDEDFEAFTSHSFGNAYGPSIY
jgi:hypothetical protein